MRFSDLGFPYKSLNIARPPFDKKDLERDPNLENSNIVRHPYKRDPKRDPNLENDHMRPNPTKAAEAAKAGLDAQGRVL